MASRLLLTLVAFGLFCAVVKAISQPLVEAESYRSLGQSFGVYAPDGAPIETMAEIAGVRAHLEHDIQEIFKSARVGMNEYQFRVRNGSYRVFLYFAEIEKTSFGERVFGITLQGQPVVDRLDIFAEVGANRAYRVVSEYVEVADGMLRLEFQPIVGEPLLSAISIGGYIAGARSSIEQTFFAHMNCGGPNFYGYRPDFGFAPRPPG